MTKKVISGAIVAFLVLAMVPVAGALGIKDVEGFTAYRTLRGQCRELQKEYASALRASKVRLQAGEITRQEAIALVRDLRTERREVCASARASAAVLRKALKDMRLGVAPLAPAEEPVEEPMASESGVFMLSSDSFNRGSAIPLKYAFSQAGGDNVSPHLAWTGGNSNVQSYALLMYDPHPTAQNYVHWCITGIPADRTSLAEDVSAQDDILAPAVEWTNGFTHSYEGPFPPAGDGAHTYQFKLLGLNTADAVNPLDATSGNCTLESFTVATADSAVAEGWYEATYTQY